MVSLAVHLILGFAVIAWIVSANRDIFARPAAGPQVSVLEATFYVVGIAATVLGYYFNARFVAEYATPSSNPIWGPGSWQQFIALRRTNSSLWTGNQARCLRYASSSSVSDTGWAFTWTIRPSRATSS